MYRRDVVTVPGSHTGTPLGDLIARTEKTRAKQRAEAWHAELISGKKNRADIRAELGKLSPRAKDLTRAALNELIDNYAVRKK